MHINFLLTRLQRKVASFMTRADAGKSCRSNQPVCFGSPKNPDAVQTGQRYWNSPDRYFVSVQMPHASL